MDPAALITTLVNISVFPSVSPPSLPLISLPIPVDVDSSLIVPYVAPTLTANKRATFECNSDLSPWSGHVSSLEYPYDPTHVARK